MKPKPPHCRLIKENSIGECPQCGSTLEKTKWWRFKRTKCIHPECSYETTNDYKATGGFKKSLNNLFDFLLSRNRYFAE